MHIFYKQPMLHWAYFLSIEEELILTSKYVEFDLGNLHTFSTEFTKIILTASSEVDVLLTQISRMYGLTKKRPNLGDHHKIVKQHIPTLISEKIILDGCNLLVEPFKDWGEKEPDWHKTYNNLKHNRGAHFKEGNLDNALEAVGALYSTVVHFYFCQNVKSNPESKTMLYHVIDSIKAKSKLFKFENPYCK